MAALPDRLIGVSGDAHTRAPPRPGQAGTPPALYLDRPIPPKGLVAAEGWDPLGASPAFKNSSETPADALAGAVGSELAMTGAAGARAAG
jgi:hypothetical protein